MTPHLTAANDPPRPDPLARFFATAWSDFLKFGSWGGSDLQDAIEAAGLGEWREATEEDADNNNHDIEVGDPILVLTDAGRAAIEAARG
jgi:hypothetical protein